jgi:hypothetical protein
MAIRIFCESAFPVGMQLLSQFAIPEANSCPSLWNCVPTIPPSVAAASGKASRPLPPRWGRSPLSLSQKRREIGISAAPIARFTQSWNLAIRPGRSCFAQLTIPFRSCFGPAGSGFTHSGKSGIHPIGGLTGGGGACYNRAPARSAALSPRSYEAPEKSRRTFSRFCEFGIGQTKNPAAPKRSGIL